MDTPASLTSKRIGCIGCGNMGGAILGGLAEVPGLELYGYNRTPQRLEPLCAKGVTAVPDIPGIAARCDVLVIGVKPYLVGGVLAVTALMGLSACGSKTEDNKAEGKTYKVGIVQFVDDASLNQIEAAIEAELDAKAAELGVTFDYTLFNGQGDATTLNQIGAELVGKGVDLIVPIATPAVKIMQSATEDTEIPIVFSAVSDPVGSGIVDALDAPGGRITGTSDALNTKGLLDLMLAQNPDTKTVGLLYSKSEDSSKQPIADAKAYLEGKGIRCVEKTGTTTDEITSAVDALIAEKVDAVFTPTDNTVMTAELAIYEKFLNAKIPQYCGADSFALNGAFVGYGVDYTALGKMTADMVVQVLVDGKSPATLPVATFDNGIAMINTDSCTALGYDLAAVKQAFDGKCSAVLETTTQQNFD
mgnify:CR=1 FL=1